jgi:hypothetical protein
VLIAGGAPDELTRRICLHGSQASP